MTRINMGIISSLSGEQSTSKVAAIFAQEPIARSAADTVRLKLSLKPYQVTMLSSRKRAGRLLEPESHGIFKTILIAHYKLGIAGLFMGFMMFALLYGLGIAAVVRSPITAAIVITSFGMLGGLFAGGLVALRPDHDSYIQQVLEALKDGQFAVVVHAFDSVERDRAAAIFSELGKTVIKTL